MRLGGQRSKMWRKRRPEVCGAAPVPPTLAPCPRSVDALLKQTQDLIAGGAALHAWLGEPLASFGGDLDVFCGEGSWARWRELLQASGPLRSAQRPALPPLLAWAHSHPALRLLQGAGYAYRPFERKNETITPDQRAVLQARRWVVCQLVLGTLVAPPAAPRPAHACAACPCLPAGEARAAGPRGVWLPGCRGQRHRAGGQGRRAGRAVAGRLPSRLAPCGGWPAIALQPLPSPQTLHCT